MLAAEPYPGAVETISAWHEAGHFIHITSHRAVDAHPHTSEWLDEIGLPHDELYCSDDKVARCVEIGIDVLIDDSPVNLDAGASRPGSSPPRRAPVEPRVCEDVIMRAGLGRAGAHACEPVLR